MHIAILALPAILIAGAWIYAGPLDPPAGPVHSTGRTTEELYSAISALEGMGAAASSCQQAALGRINSTAGVLTVTRNGVTVTVDVLSFKVSSSNISLTTELGDQTVRLVSMRSGNANSEGNGSLTLTTPTGTTLTISAFGQLSTEWIECVPRCGGGASHVCSWAFFPNSPARIVVTDATGSSNYSL